MNRTVTIGIRDFEYKGTVCAEPVFTRRDIYDCYKIPSDTKLAIWTSWRDFFHDVCGTLDYTVSSYNCNFFTIKAKFEWDGKRYYAYITHRHNYLYEIV